MSENELARIIRGLARHARSSPATVRARELRREHLQVTGGNIPSVRRRAGEWHVREVGNVVFEYDINLHEIFLWNKGDCAGSLRNIAPAQWEDFTTQKTS